MPNEEHLDKEKLLRLLDEAKELKVFYHKGGFFDYGSIDEIALRLLERRETFVTIGIKARGNQAKIYGRICYPGSENFIATDSQTMEYVLDGIKGTTIARFVYTICEVVTRRVNNGNEELRAIMIPNAKALSNETMRYISLYLP